LLLDRNIKHATDSEDKNEIEPVIDGTITNPAFE